jgi:hypothetical protein
MSKKYYVIEIGIQWKNNSMEQYGTSIETVKYPARRRKTCNDSGDVKARRARSPVAKISTIDDQT